MYGNPVAPSEVELTFNPSFYPSLVRMPMARYRRNIWKSGGSRLSVCPWQEIRWLPVVRVPMARYRRNIWKSGGSLVK